MRPGPDTSVVPLSRQGRRGERSGERSAEDAPSTAVAVRQPTSVLRSNTGLSAHSSVSSNVRVATLGRFAASDHDIESTNASALARFEDPSAQHEVLKLVQTLFLPVGTSTDGLRSVMFAAPEASPDSEMTSASTAETLAMHTTGTVCLVDANLRDPSLHRHFSVGNATGFADALNGTRRAPAVAVQVAAKLWLVPAGMRRSRQDASQDRLSGAVADLLAAFDFVIVGACSLGAQPDAIHLALSVDGVVLVIDHERTRRDAARRSVDALQAAQARVLGVVFRSRSHAPSGSWRRQ